MRLRALRKGRGWTQSRVAIEIGCSRSTVSMWETRGHSPAPSHLHALSRLFEVPIAELIQEIHDESPLRRMRRSAGLRQKDVAKSLHVGVPTYSDVETGRQSVPARWVPILAAAFRVPVSAICALYALPGRNEAEGAG
ncbi:helix-turn-helix domain-containing protein [Streptomyces sp. NPDC059534]|uniref:helix-turn-helix domain-containing protein n=1 Tax=Streptomyces sp. NPDC059534 TaxID=3346859 RepID=UPI0036C54369